MSIADLKCVYYTLHERQASLSFLEAKGAPRPDGPVVMPPIKVRVRVREGVGVANRDNADKATAVQ